MAPRKIGQPTTYFPAAIPCALPAAGYRTLTALGKITGIKSSRLSMILGGFIPEPDEQERIASALKLKVTDIWLPVAAS